MLDPSADIGGPTCESQAAFRPGAQTTSAGRGVTDARVSDTSSPANDRLPVNISNSTQPNAHTSLRRSASRPLACSGLIYAAVPRTIPACVIAGVVMVGDNE